MRCRIFSTLNSTLNMMEGSGLMESSKRIMSLVTRFKPMLVNESLWTQMMLRVKIEGVVRMRRNVSWLEMNWLVYSRIRRHMRMFCSIIVTMVTILIFVTFHNLVLINCLFIS